MNLCDDDYDDDDKNDRNNENGAMTTTRVVIRQKRTKIKSEQIKRKQKIHKNKKMEK